MTNARKAGLLTVLALFLGIAFMFLWTDASFAWSTKYDGTPSGDEEAVASGVSSSGDLFVTGRSRTGDSGWDFYTAKYETGTATRLWFSRYAGPAGLNDEPASLAVDADANVIVTGRSEVSQNASEIVTVKYNGATGKAIWRSRYSGRAGGENEPAAVAVDGDGNVLVAGKSRAPDDSFDVLVMKLAKATGKRLWAVRYSARAGYDETAAALAVDGDGNLCVAGKAENVQGNADTLMIKYDGATGNRLWVSRYVGPRKSDDEAVAVALDPTGGVLVASKAALPGTASDYLVLKYDAAAGGLLWTARYDGPAAGDDVPAGMAVDASGNVIVTGYSRGTGDKDDYATVKWDSGGNQIWVNRYEGPAGGNDQASSVAVDASGAVYVTGRSEGYASHYDAVTVKYGPAGECLWARRYNNNAVNGDEGAAKLVLNGTADVYVTGTGVRATGQEDFLSLSYPQAGRSEFWSIGFYTSPTPLHIDTSLPLGNPVLTGASVTDVPAEFVADPFMLKSGARWYLFFEVFNARTGLGDIGLATSVNGTDWSYRKVVIHEPFHLAYPYVFTWNGEYYLMPAGTRELAATPLYKAVNFPLEWTRVTDILSGHTFLDSSIFRYGNRWWLFSDVDADGVRALRLYGADQLEGPWTEHPASPIVVDDANISRPGGRVIQYGDRLIRYAHDDTPTYGNQVWAFEITELTETTYAEQPAGDFPVIAASGSGWNASGMHNIDPHQVGTDTWFSCVDALGPATAPGE